MAKHAQLFEPEEEIEAHMKAERDAEREAAVAESAPSVEPAGPERAEKPEAQPRGEDGKFAPKGEPQKLAPEGERKPPEALGKPPDGFVAHGAFHEERERRKALQTQLQASSERQARMEERFNILVARLQQGAEPAPPEKESDPVGYFDYHTRQLAGQTQGVAQELAELKAWRENQAQQANFVNAYSNAASQFAAQHKDFGRGYAHYLKSRMDQLLD